MLKMLLMLTHMKHFPAARICPLFNHPSSFCSIASFVWSRCHRPSQLRCCHCHGPYGRLWNPVLIVDSFPSGSAGAPIADGSPNCMGPCSAQELPCHNIWASFCSQNNWEIACWAKRHGTTPSAVTELLAMPEVYESCFWSANESYKVVKKLGLSYSNAKELNRIIDQFPGRPLFKKKAVVVCNESVELYYREIIPCIWRLLGILHLHTISYLPQSMDLLGF